MRRIFKYFAQAIFILAIVAIAISIWKREEIPRLLAVNSLCSEEKIITNFSAMNTAFLSVDVPRGDGPVAALPAGPEMALNTEIEQWITDRTITSLAVLKDGALVHESYYQGTDPDDLRISWSIAKSYLSALLCSAFCLRKAQLLQSMIPSPNTRRPSREGLTMGRASATC